MSEATDQRLHALDILRGLALFGMILVHFHQRMRREVSGVEDLIGWAVYIFVEQKAWGTFAFLFGVGFAVLLRRLDRRGLPVAPIYLRRLGALAIFGIVADVCFGFHILLSYASWGVVLLLIRNWSTTSLLVTAVVCASARSVVGELFILLGVSPSMARDPQLALAVDAATRQPEYLALLGARWALFAGSFPPTWRNLLPDSNLALFIVGLLALRHGVFDDPVRHTRLVRGAMVFGAIAWASSWLALPLLPPLVGREVHWPVLFGFGILTDQWLCLTYIGAIVLLLAYRPEWSTRLRAFGDSGRMALTNYLLQAAVLDALGSGYGWGLTLRPLAYAPAAVLLFGVEAAFSRAWLRRFRFGPLEWIWRTITYASRQPLRRPAAAPLPAQRSEAGVGVSNGPLP
jgi:uncharacterized protein